MNSITIPKKIFQSLLLCTFRYALGRRSYISSNVSEWILEYWDEIPESYKRQMHEDIESAIERGHAGDDCDIASWEKVLKLKVSDNDTKKSS